MNINRNTQVWKAQTWKMQYSSTGANEIYSRGVAGAIPVGSPRTVVILKSVKCTFKYEYPHVHILICVVIVFEKNKRWQKNFIPT
jgi:hypothetical protein